VGIHYKGIHPGLTGTKIRPHINLFPEELDNETIEPEILRCVQKLRETWNEKCEFLEELNAKFLKARSDDPTNNRFQVSADTLKLKRAKVGKSDMCHDWRMPELPLYITAGNGE
jgi:hypothetical protein